MNYTAALMKRARRSEYLVLRQTIAQRGALRPVLVHALALFGTPGPICLQLVAPMHLDFAISQLD